MQEEAEVAQVAAIEAEQVTPQQDVTEEGKEGQVEGQPAAAEEGAEEHKAGGSDRNERRRAYKQKLREEAEAAKREADTLRRRSERILANTGTAPTEAEFPDPIEYAAALGAYRARQSGLSLDAKMLSADAEEAEARANQAEQSRLQQVHEAFNEDARDAATRYADFDQALTVAQNSSIVSPELSMMVIEGDRPADIAYWLGKNPAEAIRLSQLPPIMAARELGRIEASLNIPQPKTQTNAPAPITPVNGRGAVSSKNSDDMTLAEFVAWRAAGGTPERA